MCEPIDENHAKHPLNIPKPHLKHLGAVYFYSTSSIKASALQWSARASIIRYALEKNRIHIQYQVKNIGPNTMYCGFGGHPGFNIPLEPGLCFEDYVISFPDACQVNVVEFSQDVLTLGKKAYSLTDDRIIPLNHKLFLRDAVVLCDCPREITLSSNKGRHGITVRFPDMPYVGFWQVPNKDAPYLCIEPWSILPGRAGIVEDIATMPDMTKILPQHSAVNTWSIEIF